MKIQTKHCYFLSVDKTGFLKIKLGNIKTDFGVKSLNLLFVYFPLQLLQFVTSNFLSSYNLQNTSTCAANIVQDALLHGFNHHIVLSICFAVEIRLCVD